MSSTTSSRAVDAINSTLTDVGVSGFVHARDLETGNEVGVGDNTPVVLASVFKVPIAIELARQFEAGILDPSERVRVPVEGRTPGGTGLSVLVDDVEISLRDLAQLMITVSDNAATDIVAARVGIDNINANLGRLGLHNTAIEGDCAWLLGRLVQDLALTDEEQELFGKGAEEEAFALISDERWQACRDLVADTTNRTTPRDMTRLLQLIWNDEAAPPEACAFVRRIMGQQVWPHRLRSGFPGDVKTSGKTGTLPFVRNEVGVVEYPDGGRYAVAVFIRQPDPRLTRPEWDAAIGTVARQAVDHLRIRD